MSHWQKSCRTLVLTTHQDIYQGCSAIKQQLLPVISAVLEMYFFMATVLFLLHVWDSYRINYFKLTSKLQMECWTIPHKVPSPLLPLTIPCWTPSLIYSYVMISSLREPSLYHRHSKHESISPLDTSSIQKALIIFVWL